MRNIKIQELWKQLARDKRVNPVATVAYSLIRAMNSKSNDKVAVARGILLSAFTPISNTNKLANGNKPFQSLDNSISSLSVLITMAPKAVFGGEILTEDEMKSLADLVKEVRKDPYFVVRQDISREQQAVQLAHVAMVLDQAVPRNSADAYGLSFVMFGVPGRDELITKKAWCTSKGVQTVHFNEPDMGNDITAFACFPMRKSRAIRKELFKDMQLMVLGDNTISIAAPPEAAAAVS